jgi:hypothetical protein
VGLLAGCGEDEQCHDGDVDEERGFGEADGDQEGYEHSLLSLRLAEHARDELRAGDEGNDGGPLVFGEIAQQPITVS